MNRASELFVLDLPLRSLTSLRDLRQIHLDMAPIIDCSTPMGGAEEVSCYGHHVGIRPLRINPPKSLGNARESILSQILGHLVRQTVGEEGDKSWAQGDEESIERARRIALRLTD